MHQGVQGSHSAPLRHVLQGQTSLERLSPYERGHLSNMLARLRLSHIGVVIDDRRSGGLAAHDGLLSALGRSSLAESLCILGPAAEDLALTDDQKGRLADALEAYDRARQAPNTLRG